MKRRNKFKVQRFFYPVIFCIHILDNKHIAIENSAASVTFEKVYRITRHIFWFGYKRFKLRLYNTEFSSVVKWIAHVYLVPQEWARFPRENLTFWHRRHECIGIMMSNWELYMQRIVQQRCSCDISISWTLS